MTYRQEGVLTIDDIDNMPNGTATVYVVYTSAQMDKTQLGKIDDHGVLRSIDKQRVAFSQERCSVKEVHQP